MSHTRAVCVLLFLGSEIGVTGHTEPKQVLIVLEEEELGYTGGLGGGSMRVCLYACFRMCTCIGVYSHCW